MMTRSPLLKGERILFIQNIVELLDVLAERYQLLDMRNSAGFVLNAKAELMKLKHLEEIMK